MSDHAVHLCLGFDESEWAERRPRTDRRGEGCAGHTPCPAGYVQWHEWAEWIDKTHRNVRCTGCDRYAVWVPRRNKAALAFLAEDRA